MPIIAAARKTDVIPMAAFLHVGGTAADAGLLLGRMAQVESLAAAPQPGAAPGTTQTLTARTFSSPRHPPHYWEAGPIDGPLMIFLHGWPGVGLLWRGEIEAFAVRGWDRAPP